MHNHTKQSYAVHLRAYKPTDFESLARMVQEAWHTENDLSTYTQYQLGVLDAIGCMNRSTHIIVATVLDTESGREQVAGCAAVVDRRHRTIKPYRSWFMRRGARAVATLLAKPQHWVRNSYELLQLLNYQRNDHKMLRQAHQEHMHYQGELALFIVDQHMRGFGLGKQLWQAAMEWFTKRNIAQFFLFTDSTCDWQYYDHIGLTRRVTLPTQVQAIPEHVHNPDHAAALQADTGTMTMMLYDGLVRKLIN